GGRARENAEQLLDGARIRAAGTIEVVGAGQNLEAGFVRDGELAQELAIETVQVVDGVEQRVFRPHTEEQRGFTQAGFQVDDDRRPPAQPRDLHAAVDGNRRRAGAALRAEKHQRPRVRL